MASNVIFASVFTVEGQEDRAHQGALSPKGNGQHGSGAAVNGAGSAVDGTPRPAIGRGIRFGPDRKGGRKSGRRTEDHARTKESRTRGCIRLLS